MAERRSRPPFGDQRAQRLLRPQPRPARRGFDARARRAVAGRTQRDGKDDAVQCDRRPAPGRQRLDPFPGRGARRPHAGGYRPARPRLCAAGPAPVAVAHSRRAPAARRRQRPLAMDDPAHLRNLPAARGAAQQSRQSAVRRRAADARDFARAPAQPAPARHGRTDRGPGAGHRRAGRRNAGQSRRTWRHRRPRRRAEYRRRDRGGRESRDHDQRPGQPGHGRGAARGGSRTATKAARRRAARPRRNRPKKPPRRRSRQAKAGRPAKARGPVRVYVSNPILPTRWSQPVAVAQIETAARTHTAAPEPATQRRGAGGRAAADPPRPARRR